MGEHVIAVLFAMQDGCYSVVNGVDLWHKERDARKYNGPHPVIAHPPCQLWGKFAKINYKRWGGEHNRPGNDGGCFEFALASVNNYGGVLEHPTYSYAWQQYGLERPIATGWTESVDGFVCEINQASYGHRATKKPGCITLAKNHLNYDGIRKLERIK